MDGVRMPVTDYLRIIELPEKSAKRLPHLRHAGKSRRIAVTKVGNDVLPNPWINFIHDLLVKPAIPLLRVRSRRDKRHGDEVASKTVELRVKVKSLRHGASHL